VRETSDARPLLVVPAGTQVVLRVDQQGTASHRGHVKGTVAEIVRVPADGQHSYGIRFPDGGELSLHRTEFSILKQVKAGPVSDPTHVLAEYDLHRYVIYQCVVGSRAYGLSRDDSDVDRRGIYLPPADLQWSLYGVPEQLENREAEECFWELQKFISLALKANPNILECLFTPLIERTSEVSEALLAQREMFLSKLVFQTYNGYVMSQFKKLEQDLRAKEVLNWKHAMHLIRLLLQGISVLNEQRVAVDVGEQRSALLAIRDGSRAWAEVNRWRLALHDEFEKAFQATKLPDAPDYERANRLLIWARRSMVEDRDDS
jgi:predicted nucleotidyltransferase